MPEFSFSWIESGTGLERRERLTSPTKAQALEELRHRSIALTSLVEIRSPASRPSAEAPPAAGRSGGSTVVPARRPWTQLRRRPGPKALAAFTRQMSILVNAGVPVHRALTVLARAEPNRHFQRTIRMLAGGIESGGALSEALAAEPGTFGRLYRHMVEAGEAGGALGTVLERLAQFLERNARVRGKVQAAMAYPLVVLVLAGGILAVLMVVVVPRFELIFHGLLRGQPLPAVTRALLAASSLVSQHLLVALAMGGAAALLARRLLGTEWGGSLRDKAVLKLPVAGDLLQRAALARFSRTLGALLASGVPILPALMIARTGLGNRVIAEAVTQVHGRVRQGASIAPSLAETKRFPHLVTSMVEVGEETGDLPGMLARIAEVYEGEVDNAVAALIAVVEPALIVGMALMVGFIVIALFLPVVGLLEHLQ